MAKRKFSYNEEDLIDSNVEETVTAGNTDEAEEVKEENQAPKEEIQVEKKSPNKYTFAELDTEMYATSNATVRSLPSKDGEKLGKLETGEIVTVTGQCNENGYYRIAYNESEGFVSKTSLDNNKVEDKSTEETVEDKSIIINFEFSRTRRREKKDRRTMVLITGSTKEAVDKLLEEKYQESFNELVNELLDRWVDAHKNK